MNQLDLKLYVPLSITNMSASDGLKNGLQHDTKRNAVITCACNERNGNQYNTYLICGKGNINVLF